jgi:hypothetical protein
VGPDSTNHLMTPEALQTRESSAASRPSLPQPPLSQPPPQPPGERGLEKTVSFLSSLFSLLARRLGGRLGEEGRGGEGPGGAVSVGVKKAWGSETGAGE